MLPAGATAGPSVRPLLSFTCRVWSSSSLAPAGTIALSRAAATVARPSQQATGTSMSRDEKRVSHLLPERPGGCFAQKVTDPFFAARDDFFTIESPGQHGHPGRQAVSL